MIKNLTIAAFALIAATSTAFANGILSDTASPIAKIIQDHANAGDTAISASNPEVRFRVLDNGMVERTNSRFDTSMMIDPSAELRDRNRR